MHRTRRTAAITALLFAAIAARLAAGPLDPPAGPVAPTPGPEPRIAINATHTPGDADSLFRIAAPGSYYLSGNVTGIAAKNGIEIAASNVTIDLNGFTLIGVPGSLDGINVSIAAERIEVRNGAVTDWGLDGIDMGTPAAAVCTVLDVRATRNGGSGIRTGPASIVTGCVCRQNTGRGISVDVGCIVSGCICDLNAFGGILTGRGCTISGCTATLNSDTAIATGFCCTVTGCSVFDNENDGIVASFGSTLSNNTCRANGADGIRVSSLCLVLNNTSTGNGETIIGGSGISVTGNDNRIEGNNCCLQDQGIEVDGPGNIIVRNTCSGNTTNWEIAFGNHYGPIIDRTGVNPPAVNGNSAADALGSTHPNANFSY